MIATDSTLKWMLSLVSNNPWRDIYLRLDDFSEIDLLRNTGWIELADIRVIDASALNVERTYRLTRPGMSAAVKMGIIPEKAARIQDINATYPTPPGGEGSA